ncbi:hypothetical protein EGW08_015854, partial [Elysia chlorotica]
AAHDIAQHRQSKQDFIEPSTATLINTKEYQDLHDETGNEKKEFHVLDAREVAIQANDYEIERKFSHLPARKRYIPLKFSDYRVFDGASQSENKREEHEEETDSTFKPVRDVEKKARKPLKKRGRPRKNVETIISEEDAASNQMEIDGKAAIMKVAAGFKCSICGHIFSLRGNAKSHLITHTDKKPFSCDFEGCGKSLRTKEALRRHQLSHLGIKMFECSVCHKKLSTNISLQEHMTVHSGERPLVCPVCGKKFRQKAVMKRHIVTHSSEKPYACTVCGKRFSMKVYVKSHMKVHTGERPFICETCSKSFAHASDLKRHKIIHTGEKPYACSICSMRYNDVSSRKRHEREHQTGQQYLCSMCNQRFSRAGHLRSHLVKVHNMGSSGLYEVQSVDKGAQDSWPPGTGETKYVSLLPSAQGVNLVAPKGQARKKQSEDNGPQTVQLLVGTADSCLNDMKAAEFSHVKVERSEDNIELSVFDPTLDRLDTLPPGFTCKIIEHPNSNNILEFHLEKTDDIQPSNTAGLSIGDITGETSLTVIKDESTDTLMVIQQEPAPSIVSSEQQHAEIDSESTSGSKWQVCVGLDPSGGHTYAKQIQTTKDQDTRQAEPNTHFENTSLSTNKLEKNSNLVSKSDVLDIPNNNEERVDNTKHFEDPLMVAEAVSDQYIYHPDLTSQEYYNWLSVFTEYCKALPLPLKKEMFQRISHVQKTLTDFMALPSGVITEKNNFKVLMSITNDLSDIISSHLMLMYENLS